ncbi:chitinase domain protein [Legionella busanensis]|uniref:Chitinase domain protein n=1 Tax=Legionella busanensis TaxID=190655 RepID=A0A378JPN9_9GAMM|nr:chitinase [Legionella busanensis]STX52648.1 chitinase domain protein [Legionella busanensis]
MKKLIIAFCTFFVIQTPSFAAGTASTTFSPYADITINTRWDSQYEDMEPMDLTTIALNQGIKSYRLAFITDSGSCQPAWGGQATYSVANQWGKHLTDKLAENNIAVAVSFGGASGNDISLNCNKEQLITLFNDTVKIYKAKALDFDIENGTANVSKLMQALQVFHQQNPKIQLSFTLPVMPEGLTSTGKSIVEAAKSAGINFHVNIMAMDYGPAYAGDMGEYAIQAATALHDYLKTLYPAQADIDIWHLVEVTTMIGVNDVNVEQFTLQNADRLAQFAKEKELGLLSMWSIARDKPCADKWASPTCSGNNLQLTDFEFTKHFQI